LGIIFNTFNGIQKFVPVNERAPNKSKDKFTYEQLRSLSQSSNNDGFSPRARVLRDPVVTILQKCGTAPSSSASSNG